MKRLLTAITLTCLLSVSALAGDVPIVPGPTPPAPIPGEIPTVNSTAPGDMPISDLTLLLTLLDIAF